MPPAESPETVTALLEEVTALRRQLDETSQRLATARGLPHLASDELTRNILEAIPGGLVHVAATGAILAANEAALRILGLSYDALTRRYTQDFEPETLHEDGTPCGVADYPVTQALLTGKRPPAKTIGIRQRDGSISWAHFSAIPVFGDPLQAQAVTSAIVTFLDVTEMKRAEAALRRSEELFRSVVESAPTVIAMTDREGRIVFISQRVYDYLGSIAWERVVPADQAVVRNTFDAVIRGGTVQTFDATSTDGTQWRANVGPRYEQGAIVGATYVAWDVSEQKRMETRLAIADRMASVGTLSASVAHEVNNPLTYVMANVEWAVRQALEVGQLKIADRLGGALEGIGRIRNVVTSLASFARTDDAPRERVSVQIAIEAATRLVRNEVRHRAQLRLALSDVPPVLANEGRLVQVFVNLLVNAAQAIPEGNAENNEVTIATRLDGAADTVVVEVCDTGSGIPESLRDTIFEPFVTTKPRGVGTGLGLYICRNLLTSFGGDLTVESTVGAGSTFAVRLPVAPALSARQEASDEAAPPRSARRLRVLVVDDEEAIGRALALFMTEHEVELAESGHAAIEQIAARAYDVVFCDLMMPDGTGMDVHEWLVAHRPAMAERLIFMTGGAFTARARAFLDECPRTVIEKPFTELDVRRALAERA